MTIFLLVSALITLALSAFCSGIETCFLSVSRERILHLSREGGRKAKLVQRALSDMPRTMTTILIGNNLANSAYSTATAAIIAATSDLSIVRSLLNFLAAFIVLYAAEFMPKLLCAARPLRRSLMLSPAYTYMALPLRPLSDLLMRLTDLFLPDKKEPRHQLTSADIVRILQDRKDGVCLSDFESAIISRIIILRIKNRPVTSSAILSVLKSV